MKEIKDIIDYKLAQRIEAIDAAIDALQKSRNAKPFTRDDNGAHYAHETAMTKLDLIYADLEALMAGAAMGVGTSHVDAMTGKTKTAIKAAVHGHAITPKIAPKIATNGAGTVAAAPKVGPYTAKVVGRAAGAKVKLQTKLATPRRGKHLAPEKVAALTENMAKIQRSRKTIKELAADYGVSTATIVRVRQGKWTP
jgi:hypothetical protein